MRALRNLYAVTRYFIIALSVIAAFATGAVFAETRISQQPSVLTFYLASVPCPPTHN
jgi:hypothetical protein